MHTISKYSNLISINSPFLGRNISRPYCSRPHFTNYALLIGGGNIEKMDIGNQTEFVAKDENDWRDLSNIKTALLASKFFKEENIKVLFGLGEKTKFVDLSLLSHKQFLKITPGFHCGAATLQDIDFHLKHLSDQMQANDKLWIFLNGHGAHKKGLILASENEASRKNLRVDFVKEKLKIFDTKKIILFVNSCFAGQYNSLTASNIAVLTTTNAYRPSYTSRFETEHIKHLMLTFQGSSTFMERHIQGALHEKNYHCCDSLVYLIDRHFRRTINAQTNYLEEFRLALSNQIDQTKPLLFLAFVVTQPVSYSLALGMGVILNGYKRAIFCSFPVVNRIYNLVTGLKLRTVYQDKKITESIKQHLHNREDSYRGFKQLSLQEQDRLNYFAQQLRSSLKSYKEATNHTPLAYYHYLEEKVNLFFQSATAKDLKLFLSVCENLFEGVGYEHSLECSTEMAS